MKNKILLSMLLSISLFANESCDKDTSGLLTELLGSHPSIKMSQEMVNGSKEKVDSAFWQFFPTPSADVSVRDSDRNATTLRLDQPLWTGGKISNNYDLAVSKENENSFALEETSFKLIETYFNLIETYFQSKSNIQELNSSIDQLLQLESMLDRRMDAGISSVSDKDLLSARIAQTQNDLEIAKNKHTVSKLQLELLLDKKLDCDIKLSDVRSSESTNIQKNVETLLSFHPTIKKFDAMLKSTNLEMEVTKSSYMPNLGLRAEHRDGDLYNDNSSTKNQNLVYVTFNMTTKAGLSSVSEIAAARSKVSEYKFRKTVLEKELVDSLLSDYNNYEVTKKNIKIVTNSINLANSVLDSYTRLFLAGKKQWLDLVNATNELKQYKIQLANLKVSENVLSYKLALKSGKINLMTGEIK